MPYKKSKKTKKKSKKRKMKKNVASKRREYRWQLHMKMSFMIVSLIIYIA